MTDDAYSIPLQVSPALIWCRGAKTALIMHLHQERFQKVPLGVAELLDFMGFRARYREEILDHFSGHAELVASYIDYLLGKKWILRVPDFLRYEPVDLSPHNYFPIHNLYISASSTTPEQWFVDICKWMRKTRSSSSLILVLHEQGTDLSDIGRLLAASETLGFHNIGIYVGDTRCLPTGMGSALDRVSFILCGSRIESNVVVDDDVNLMSKLQSINVTVDSTNKFPCNVYSQKKIANGTHNGGNIFIDGTFNVYPHIFDTEYHLGQARNLDELEEAVKSEAFTRYATIGKDSIRKCKDCEYRRICMNPLWTREDPNDISSAPSNCFYDPYKSEWAIQPVIP